MPYPKGRQRREKQTFRRRFTVEEDDEPILSVPSEGSSDLFSRLRGKPFWNWEEGEQHKPNDELLPSCCFNHIIGLPENKPGLPRAIFDFQRELHDKLFERTDPDTDKHIWIKKATGIGGTAFYLRFMVWLATRNDDLAGSRMCIVTGPNQDLANDLIERVRQLFVEHPEVDFAVNSARRLQIKNVMFQAFPSNHMDAMRGIDRISFVLADEFAFFGKQEQETENPRTIIERYVGKWDPWIVIMSTPNLEDDMFGSIEFETKPIYKRIFLHYTIGVGKVYTVEEIERAKKTPSFRREFCLEYLGAFGDLFKPESIELAIKQGEDVEAVTKNLIRQDTRKVMGIDAGYGSSSFGIVVTQLNMESGKIEVLYADDFQRPDINDMIEHILYLRNGYKIEKIYIDGSNNPVIMALKKAIGERTDYQEHMQEVKHKSLPIEHYMDIIPVYFNQEGRSMLTATYMILDKGWLAINSKFNKLITSLRTARAREGLLDKTTTNHNDVLDAFRLCLKRYSTPES